MKLCTPKFLFILGIKINFILTDSASRSTPIPPNNIPDLMFSFHPRFHQNQASVHGRCFGK